MKQHACAILNVHISPPVLIPMIRRSAERLRVVLLKAFQPTLKDFPNHPASHAIERLGGIEGGDLLETDLKRRTASTPPSGPLFLHQSPADK